MAIRRPPTTFSDSITGADLASNIAISTTGNIATTGSGTLTSAGAFTASGGIANAGTISAGTFNGTLGSSARANSIQPASGQSLVLNDEGGSSALTIDSSGLIFGHYAGKTNVQIPDDNVYSFTPQSTKGTCLVYCTDDVGDHFYAWFGYAVGSGKYIRELKMGGTNVLYTVTGTATTSNVTDGYFGALASSDGKLYFINRTGMASSTSYFSIVMLGR